MNNKTIGILRECAFWGAVSGVAFVVLWLYMLLLGTWSLAEGGTDSCARAAEVVLKSCGSLFYK